MNTEFIVSLILKLLLIVALAVSVLVLLRRLLSLKRFPSPAKYLSRWRRALCLILALSLLGGGAAAAQAALAGQYEGSVKIGFNYPNASKGLAPNGTIFNVNEILSDEVLEAAINDGGLTDLTVEDLKACLSVTTASETNQDLSADTLYVSTEYNLNYQPTLKTALYTKDQILTALTGAYRDYFLNMHGRKTDVLSADFSELKDMDFLDVCTWFESNSNDINSYMWQCGEENSTFISEATQESFDSIRGRVENFRSVSLERFRAYVLQYGIAENKEQYITRLEYNNRLSQVEYLKSTAGYRVRLAAINSYDRDVITPVMVPTRDEEGQFYQSRTRIGTDDFAAEADTMLANASEAQLDMETRNYYINMLTASAGGNVELAQAEIMEKSLIEELQQLIELALTTVEEYESKTVENYLNFSSGDAQSAWLGYAKSAAVYFCVLFAVLSAAAALKEEKPAKKVSNGRNKAKVSEPAQNEDQERL